MKYIRNRFATAILTFCIGVTLTSLWFVNRHKLDPSENLEVPGDQQFPSKQTSSSDALITLKRTGCYGPCPVYTLTIFADGTINFEAKRYWPDNKYSDDPRSTALIQSYISQEQLQQLISEFEKANYFSLNDSYVKEGCSRVLSDMHYVYTSFQSNGREKSIEHYMGCIENSDELRVYPKKLYELENKIDEIVNTKQWMR
jgi:hypothetical protein